MRLATYNIEWFANLFDRNDRLIVDDSWSGRHDVTKAQQVEAIAKVLTAIDADAVLVVEAPNTGKRQNIADRGGRIEQFRRRYNIKDGEGEQEEEASAES